MWNSRDLISGTLVWDADVPAGTDPSSTMPIARIYVYIALIENDLILKFYYMSVEDSNMQYEDVNSQQTDTNSSGSKIEYFCLLPQISGLKF